MTNAISMHIDRDDGTTLPVNVSAEWADPRGYGLEHATIYSIWVNVDDPAGFIEVSDDRAKWEYHNGDLSFAEQDQIITFLKRYKESDWDY